MNKGLVAIATGSFAMGFAEFVMMGILPVTAAGVNVSVPDAGTFISSYAMGVCAGTLILVFGRRVPPKRLLLLFMVLCCAGNALAACAPNAEVLTAARFVSGLPHGAFFGTATIAAQQMAEPGKAGTAVAIMVLGQTVANTVGVPFGTLLAGMVSWRAAFAFVAVWAVGSFALIARWVPYLLPIRDTGLAGQFAFLGKPGPWLVLGGVLLGSSGMFTWWSYVSPWLADRGGFAAEALPWLLALAGGGMVVGSLLGGKLTDAATPGKMSAAGQAVALAALLTMPLLAHGPAAAAALMALCTFGMFFVSSPQQLLMVQVGRGGGEMIGGACVQVAFNGGNALGATVGQAALNAGTSYQALSLAGVPFSLCSVALFALFFLVFEKRYAEGAQESAQQT